MFLYLLPFVLSTTFQLNENALAPGVQKIDDPWLSQDKFLHFSMSAAITGFSYYASVEKFDMELDKAKTLSVSVTALIGLGKELYDKKKKGRFSWKDLFWDSAGIAAGYLFFCK